MRRKHSPTASVDLIPLHNRFHGFSIESEVDHSVGDKFFAQNLSESNQKDQSFYPSENKPKNYTECHNQVSSSKVSSNNNQQVQIVEQPMHEEVLGDQVKNIPTEVWQDRFTCADYNACVQQNGSQFG